MNKHAEISTSLNNGKWSFNDYKVVKVLGPTKDRIAFQRKGKYTRGLSISRNAFLKMEDVTIVPGMEMELEPNIYLKHHDKSINLVKYCETSDHKRCDGGFFSFTTKEWIYFWTTMRKAIIEYLDK